MLSALEGAIRGVRWHAIPLADRDALWRQYVTDAARGGGYERRTKAPA
jgi:hypothetical protein